MWQRWFGHLDHRSVDDWVSACKKMEVAGARCKGRNRKTWKECVDKERTLKCLVHILNWFTS